MVVPIVLENQLAKQASFDKKMRKRRKENLPRRGRNLYKTKKINTG